MSELTSLTIIVGSTGFRNLSFSMGPLPGGSTINLAGQRSFYGTYLCLKMNEGVISSARVLEAVLTPSCVGRSVVANKIYGISNYYPGLGPSIL